LGLLAARIARDLNIPLVSTYHTLYDRYLHYLFFMPTTASNSLLHWWMPEYYNRCANVIVPSRVAEQSLREYGVSVRITVIPTGVALPPERALTPGCAQAARDRWSIPTDAPLLLYVGRVAREKNIELLIEAFSIVAEHHSHARLLLIGGGPYLDTCRRAALDAPYGDRIVFAGPLPRVEIDPAYAAADLFVFGSTTETQGLVVAEARAAGLPTIAVDAGGAAESIKDGEDGLIVPADPVAFATAVAELLADRPRLRSMADACRTNARDYTPEAMADRVIDVYRSAQESSRTPALAV
jgi:glycosyltransferase involved in cell wall biosynthesis